MITNASSHQFDAGQIRDQAERPAQSFDSKSALVSSPLFFVLIFLLLTYVPHLFWQPIWVSMFFILLCAYRLLASFRGWSLPSGRVRLILCLLAFSGVFLFWGKPIGMAPGSALLALMLALKTLELTDYRDAMITLFLGLFLLFSMVLFSQTLVTGLYLIVLVWLFCLTLMRLHQTRTHLPSILGQSSLLFFHALPLALACFVFFPRLPGSLIGIQDTTAYGITGLSDHMSPGSISQLVQSSEVAFRATFKDTCPKPKDRYWRVIIFNTFDGQTWTQGKITRPEYVIPVRSPEELIRYTITMEPSSEKRLAALDMPVHYPQQVSLSPGLILRSPEILTQKYQYSLTSALSYTLPALQASQQRNLIRDPAHNPKTQQLAETLHDNSDSQTRYIQNILDYLAHNGFTYTLRPLPLSPANPIDDFLFRTKQGYCEHYAQAMTWMLRDQGIPARIVAGYQGGEQNALGDYLIVRQSDAHAWVEAYVPGQGWIRVDPTTVVAPERITRGIQAIASEVINPTFFQIQGLGWLEDLWHGFRLGVDAVNYTWHRWVINYTFSRQSQLFKKLHLGDSGFQALSTTILLTMFILFALLGLSALILFRPFPKKEDNILKWYALYQKRLSKAGCAIIQHEGPLDLAHRAKEHFPAWDQEIQTITGLYIQLRYSGRPQTKKDMTDFKKAVQAFQPKKG
jgi:transglutaminase-like putative cysteine protease